MKKFYQTAIILFLLCSTTFVNAQCWKQLSAGQLFNIGIQTDGTLWAWGYNLTSQLGNGNNTNLMMPAKIGTDTTWVNISTGKDYTMAVKANGTLWGWGSNGSGKLGDGTTTLRNTPTQIGTATNWDKVYASEGNFTVAIKKDSTLWAWGNNASGQCGIGMSGANVLTPTKIGIDKTWLSATAGLAHAVAIKKDGSIWSWGIGGILGDTSTANKLVPTQIGNATNWKTVTAGQRHTLAVKANGSLWAWGDNQFGQLGDGTTVAKSIPLLIGTASNWLALSAWENSSMATKTNNTLFGWGVNTFGQLGDGTVANKFVPTQIGTATDWKQITIGQSHSTGLNITNQRFASGNNGVGQIGDGSGTDKVAQTLIICAVPLALEIISFTGKKIDNAISLQWEITQNNNIENFELEKSNTGIDFNALATIDIKSTTGSNFKYAYTDFNVLSGNVYYRLKQNNKSGTTDISNIISFKNLDANVLIAYPNPVTENLFLDGVTGSNKMYIISDVYGKTLLQGHYVANKAIQVATLQSGLYFIQICGKTIRFFK